MDEPRVTRGTLPANQGGNDPYDTGVNAEHYLSLIEPRGDVETPSDLADEIVEQIFQVLRYVPESDTFVGWNGRKFEPNVLHILRFNIRMLGKNAHNRVSLKKLKGVKFINDSVSLLKDDPRIRTSSSDFDANAYELNTPNGIINLRTGKLSPHHGPRLVTKLTRCSPREERCERFHQFLEEITGSDEELQEYLQVILGACLSGSPEAHWMAFIYGPTRSGKSVMVELIAHILGDYAHRDDGKLFRKNSNDADANPKLAALMGKRLVIASEVDHGHFDDIMIKQLTGDSHITTRALYQNVVTFSRSFKIIAVGNSIPSSSETSRALEARLKIVPFKESFLGKEDDELGNKLRQESTAGYVLHWLIQGHVKYLNLGRKLPQCSQVLGATREYFSDQGTPSQWLHERCVLDDGLKPASCYAQVKHVYADYCLWKEERGEKSLAQKRFLSALPNLHTRKSSAIRLIGVHLKDPLPTRMGDWD